ncbi:MAG: hypothetical protein SU899_04350 [Chloroflexota bacterium]|nr:hypothetical protein [Chloroflexota bacterium]
MLVSVTEALVSAIFDNRQPLSYAGTRVVSLIAQILASKCHISAGLEIVRKTNDFSVFALN